MSHLREQVEEIKNDYEKGIISKAAALLKLCLLDLPFETAKNLVLGWGFPKK